MEDTTLSLEPNETDICEDYRAELERKADLQCQKNVAKSDIQILTRDVHFLAEEIKKSSLIQKWSNQNQNKLPEEQTARLCNELVDDQDLVTDMLQGLHQQQSKVDSEVAKVMEELKDYYAIK